MTKRELINIVAKKIQSHFIKKAYIVSIVEATLEVFIDILAEEKRIEIRKFGIFKIKSTPARPGRNPKTKEQVIVPARNIVQFKAGKYMKECIKKIQK